MSCGRGCCHHLILITRKQDGGIPEHFHESSNHSLSTSHRQGDILTLETALLDCFADKEICTLLPERLRLVEHI